MRPIDSVTVCFTVAMACISIQARGQDADRPPEASKRGAYVNRAAIAEALRESVFIETYYQGVFSSRDRNNFVHDGWAKAGVHAFEINGQTVDLYLKSRLYYDDNADFWNNRGETGIGARWQPSDKIGLVLFAELLHGYYTGREGLDSNPDDEPYWDVQAGAYFWQRWGLQTYQLTEDGARIHWPGTGWRELYADAIYYRRDQDNFIMTADYKEGLATARIRGRIVETYLNIEAGADTNRDWWNNYFEIGPGVRIFPFQDLDISLSLEYFWGTHWGGDPESDLDDYSDAVVTIAWWKGWM